MKSIATAVLIAAAISTAPMAHASPSVGDVCYDWKATAQDANGQTLVCTHLPDSGHLMYWETHTESWYEGFHFHVSSSTRAEERAAIQARHSVARFPRI